VATVLGDGELARRLVEQRFDHIFFTGSPRVGREVAKAAAASFTPVTLELGGKNACVVDRSADLLHASRKIAWGKFLNAGQSCVAPDYVLVDAAIEQQLLDQLVARIEEFYGPDPRTSPDFARVIHGGQLELLSEMLDGGEPVVGGRIEPDELYVAPTVLTNVDRESLLMREEIFGPLLPVLPCADLGEAIAEINSRPPGLALYLFARDRGWCDRLLAGTVSGGVCVNDTMAQMSNPILPFGGIGESGIGRYHGRETFDTFSNLRAVMRRPAKLDGAFFRYPPYEGRGRWIDLLKKFYG
jgi:aldehyde dehydrogenase (NAD+)